MPDRLLDEAREYVRTGYKGFMTLECRVMETGPALGEDKGQALVESARHVREIWERV